MDPFWSGFSLGVLAGFAVGFVFCIVFLWLAFRFVRAMDRGNALVQPKGNGKPPSDAEVDILARVASDLAAARGVPEHKSNYEAHFPNKSD